MSEQQIPHWQKLQMIKNGLLQKECVPKPKKPLKKISDKKAAEMKADSGDDALDKWFEEMRYWLNGKCAFCGGKTTWKNNDMWRIAIAHLLPKSKFKSVATNNDNWTELCWDCHTNFDSATITWDMLRDSHEWLMLQEQLKRVLPLVAEEERKNKLYSRLTELVFEKKYS
jgi:hypothetical protein